MSVLYVLYNPWSKHNLWPEGMITFHFVSKTPLLHLHNALEHSFLDQAFAREESLKISSFPDKRLLVFTPRSLGRWPRTWHASSEVAPPSVGAAVICRHRRHMRTSAVCGRSVDEGGTEEGGKMGKRREERERERLPRPGRKKRKTSFRSCFQPPLNVSMAVWLNSSFRNYPVWAFGLRNGLELGIFI